MPHNKSKPTKTPTPPGEPNLPIPVPSRVPEAPETAARRSATNLQTIVRRSRLTAHRRDVATSFQSVLKEATPSQRTLLKGVEPRAVESIGTVEGRVVSGRTFFRRSGLVGGIQRGLQAVGVAPSQGIQISMQGSDPTVNIVRHETAHAILFKQGVGPKQQHPILDRARVRKDKQIDLPSIKAAKRTKTGSTARGRNEARQNLRKRRAVLQKRK